MSVFFGHHHTGVCCGYLFRPSSPLKRHSRLFVLQVTHIRSPGLTTHLRFSVRFSSFEIFIINAYPHSTLATGSTSSGRSISLARCSRRAAPAFREPSHEVGCGNDDYGVCKSQIGFIISLDITLCLISGSLWEAWKSWGAHRMEKLNRSEIDQRSGLPLVGRL